LRMTEGILGRQERELESRVNHMMPIVLKLMKAEELATREAIGGVKLDRFFRHRDPEFATG
jgi:hypothetical protein